MGRKFRVTRERVRQLQNLALSKMRRAMAAREAQRNSEEIVQEKIQIKRMEVIREFIEQKTGRN